MNRIGLVALVTALVSPSVYAEAVGRHGGDPAVSMGSSFVRALLSEPMPKHLGPLFYLRAVIGITGDRSALLDYDSMLEEAALNRALGLPPPAGATIGEALRKHEYEHERRKRLGEQVEARSLSVLPHEIASLEAPLDPKKIRVDVANRSPLPVAGFSAHVALRGSGQRYWVYADCSARNLDMEPGKRTSVDCEPAFGPQAVYPGDDAFRELVRDALAQWKAGTAQVNFGARVVSFHEHDAPEVLFSVIQRQFGVFAEVNLKESREARTLAVANLKQASCWARGSCFGDWLGKSFNADPFTTTSLVGLVVGFVLGAPAGLLSGRHALKTGAVLSLGVLAAGGAVVWFLMEAGGYAMFMLPLAGLITFAAAGGLWIGVLVARWRTGPNGSASQSRT